MASKHAFSTCFQFEAQPPLEVLQRLPFSDLCGRVWKHRTKFYPESFSAKYNCVMLVYYQSYQRIEDAINEEKRLKGGSRKQKDDLIYSMNPGWVDLWDEVCGG